MRDFGRRKQIRRPLWRAATIDAGAGAAPIACHTEDVSQGGARIVLGRTAVVPDTFVLWLSSNGKVQRHCRVVWRNKRELGVTFCPRFHR